MAGLIGWSGDQIMSLALLKIASVLLIWLSALKICGIILDKVHYVSLGVAPTLRPNLKKSFHRFTKQINLSIYATYSLSSCVGGWWVVGEIVENCWKVKSFSDFGGC